MPLLTGRPGRDQAPAGEHDAGIVGATAQPPVRLPGNQTLPVARHQERIVGRYQPDAGELWRVRQTIEITGEHERASTSGPLDPGDLISYQPPDSSRVSLIRLPSCGTGLRIRPPRQILGGCWGKGPQETAHQFSLSFGGLDAPLRTFKPLVRSHEA